MNIKWCNYWGKSSFVCLAISEILRWPLAPSMISWYRSPGLVSLSLSWDLWIPDKLSRICRASWWWWVMMLSRLQCSTLSLVTLGIKSCISWHSNPLTFVADFTQEFFSYLTLLYWSGQKEHVSMSEPLISALTQKPTLTPINACLIKIVRHVLLHFIEQNPFVNPDDTSGHWVASSQSAVSWHRIAAAWFLLSEYFWSSESELRNV